MGEDHARFVLVKTFCRTEWSSCPGGHHHTSTVFLQAFHLLGQSGLDVDKSLFLTFMTVNNEGHIFGTLQLE